MLTFQARGHQNALFCMQIFKKISGGYTPGPPLREGATPSLHSPPARPLAVRMGALRPRLCGPKRRNLNPLKFYSGYALGSETHQSALAAGDLPPGSWRRAHDTPPVPRPSYQHLNLTPVSKIQNTLLTA